jgi:hypothetical protein
MSSDMTRDQESPIARKELRFIGLRAEDYEVGSQGGGAQQTDEAKQRQRTSGDRSQPRRSDTFRQIFLGRVGPGKTSSLRRVITSMGTDTE